MNFWETFWSWFCAIILSIYKQNKGETGKLDKMSKMTCPKWTLSFFGGLQQVEFFLSRILDSVSITFNFCFYQKKILKVSSETLKIGKNEHF